VAAYDKFELLFSDESNDVERGVVVAAQPAEGHAKLAFTVQGTFVNPFASKG